MIYSSQDNWYYWTYESNPDLKNGRQLSNEKNQLRTFYSKYSGQVKSFKEELELAAASTLDHYPGLRPSVFFSGGVDSELILRSYINIGANPEVFIVRYENDLNLYDVSFAITVCEVLNVRYNLIDFNLRRFYENDAVAISEIAQIDRPRMLPHLKFTEVADGLIIVGHSDIAWHRPSDDYSEKVEWEAIDFEHDLGCDKYNIAMNRPAVYQWWKWTPGLVLSYMNLDWFKKLMNDEYFGKRGINSTKVIGFQEAFPDMLPRAKKTGFESIDPLIDEVEAALEEKYKGLPFRQSVFRKHSKLLGDIIG